MKLCIRKSDAAIFEPSIPDDYNMGDAYRDLFSGKHNFYFRRVAHRKQFFGLLTKLVRTGEIWEPDIDEFEVVNV